MDRIIFIFATDIRRFENALRHQYDVQMNPYAAPRILVPKEGTIVFDGDPVRYRYHGQGCTVHWGNIEINYQIDLTTVYDIMFSAWGMMRFVGTVQVVAYFPSADIAVINESLQKLEKEGVVLSTRWPDNGSFHILNDWLVFDKVPE